MAKKQLDISDHSDKHRQLIINRLKKDKGENQWTSTKETSCDTGIHLASQDDSKTQPFIFVVKEAY
ncbi:MAG: hypothetical protein KIH02_06265 [Parabacteroides sp.]|nr:hypothetical protein [Parabacteroides sp.]